MYKTDFEGWNKIYILLGLYKTDFEGWNKNYILLGLCRRIWLWRIPRDAGCIPSTSGKYQGENKRNEIERKQDFLLF